jgi:hypothetical protein
MRPLAQALAAEAIGTFAPVFTDAIIVDDNTPNKDTSGSPSPSGS